MSALTTVLRRYGHSTRACVSATGRFFVVGYSVGATIAWLCSAERGLCDGVVGYYGSRIRQYPDLTPACPVLLFMPREEKSFDVAEVIETLQKKKNVHIRQLSGLHGCCDRDSPKYDKQAYHLALENADTFMQKQIPVRP